jgi:predicted ATPase
MSDGTLRAFGMLLAIAQSQAAAATAPLLVGLEEPEAALHPAAASVLLAALRRAAAGAQILVTSHSPDLLDNPDIDDGSILAVDSEEGRTRIGPIDAAGRRVLGDRLFTLGELLRQDQIEIDTAALRLSERQLDLFAPEAG